MATIAQSQYMMATIALIVGVRLSCDLLEHVLVTCPGRAMMRCRRRFATGFVRGGAWNSLGTLNQDQANSGFGPTKLLAHSILWSIYY